jgi:hypothetical protein
VRFGPWAVLNRVPLGERFGETSKLSSRRAFCTNWLAICNLPDSMAPDCPFASTTRGRGCASIPGMACGLHRVTARDVSKPQRGLLVIPHETLAVHQPLAKTRLGVLTWMGLCGAAGLAAGSLCGAVCGTLEALVQGDARWIPAAVAYLALYGTAAGVLFSICVWIIDPEGLADLTRGLPANTTGEVGVPQRPRAFGSRSIARWWYSEMFIRGESLRIKRSADPSLN